MSILDRLDLAERMEHLAGRIYRRLAEQFASDAATRELFLRLADEEDQHALRVQMLRSRYVRSDKAVGSIDLDVTKALKTAEAAESLHGRLSAQPPSSPDEARAIAVALEDALAAAHAEMLTRGCDEELRKLLTLLATQDRKHAELLRGRGTTG